MHESICLGASSAVRSGPPLVPAGADRLTACLAGRLDDTVWGEHCRGADESLTPQWEGKGAAFACVPARARGDVKGSPQGGTAVHRCGPLASRQAPGRAVEASAANGIYHGATRARKPTRRWRRGGRRLANDQGDQCCRRGNSGGWNNRRVASSAATPSGSTKLTQSTHYAND